MRKTQKLWVILGGFGACAVVLTCLTIYNAGPILSYLCSKRETIASLDVRRQRSIIITADRCWDNTRPLYYEVEEAGRVVTPATYIDSDGGDDSHEYTIFYAEDGALVAVLETTATPPHIVVMQDFKSGESWPRALSINAGSEELEKQKWRAVFDRLQRENPQLPKPAYFN